jgi:hypothetical protein
MSKDASISWFDCDRYVKIILPGPLLTKIFRALSFGVNMEASGPLNADRRTNDKEKTYDDSMARKNVPKKIQVLRRRKFCRTKMEEQIAFRLGRVFSTDNYISAQRIRLWRKSGGR